MARLARRWRAGAAVSLLALPLGPGAGLSAPLAIHNMHISHTRLVLEGPVVRRPRTHVP